MIKYLKLKDGLFFVNQTSGQETKKETVVEASMHHTFVIDCSGSMWGELAHIRKDLKNKISTMLKPNDSISIIYFSGRDQFGTLLEDYSVNSAMDFKKVETVIDKYLTCIGLTAFKQPLEELGKNIQKINAERTGVLHSMFFITDGYDNGWSETVILEAVRSVKDLLTSANIIEYGYYCNKQLLARMAAEIGGTHTFSNGFQELEPNMTKQFQNKSVAPRTYVDLEHTSDAGLVFNIQNGDFLMHTPNENGQVLVEAEGGVELFYFSNTAPKVGAKLMSDFVVTSYNNKTYVNDDFIKGLYGSIFGASRINDFNLVGDILKVLGDAELIVQKTNAFGAQNINELEAKVLSKIHNGAERFAAGYNPDLEPKEDAFCVIDMIEVLMGDEDNKWYPGHPSFGYKRIGRKAVTKTGPSDEDKAELAKLATEGKLEELKEKLENTNTNEELKFEYDDKLAGHSIKNLAWHKQRANLNVSVTYPGTIMLPETEAKEYGLPNPFPTKITRAYNWIKDGIVSNYLIPVSLTKITFDTLQSEGLLKGETWENGKVYDLDFSSLPVINRQMIDTLSAEQLFKDSFELLQLQAKDKVFNHYKKTIFNNASQGFKDKYGEEATAWLGELGLKDYGYNPKSTLESSTEETQVNTLEVKVKKLTLPGKAGDVISKYETTPDKLTDREKLLVPGIEEFKAFEKTIESMGDEDKKSFTEKWLAQKSKDFRGTKAKLMTDISKAKFLTIVGKSWFKEFSSREDKELTLPVNGMDVTFVAEDKMTTIKI